MISLAPAMFSHAPAAAAATAHLAKHTTAQATSLARATAVSAATQRAFALSASLPRRHPRRLGTWCSARTAVHRWPDTGRQGAAPPLAMHGGGGFRDVQEHAGVLHRRALQRNAEADCGRAASQYAQGHPNLHDEKRRSTFATFPGHACTAVRAASRHALSDGFCGVVRQRGRNLLLHDATEHVRVGHGRALECGKEALCGARRPVALHLVDQRLPDVAQLCALRTRSELLPPWETRRKGTLRGRVPGHCPRQARCRCGCRPHHSVQPPRPQQARGCAIAGARLAVSVGGMHNRCDYAAERLSVEQLPPTRAGGPGSAAPAAGTTAQMRGGGRARPRSRTRATGCWAAGRLETYVCSLHSL